MIEYRKSPSIFKAGRSRLAILKNTTIGGIAHRSIERKPDFLAALKCRRFAKVATPFAFHELVSCPTSPSDAIRLRRNLRLLVTDHHSEWRHRLLSVLNKYLAFERRKARRGDSTDAELLVALSLSKAFLISERCSLMFLDRATSTFATSTLRVINE